MKFGFMIIGYIDACSNRSNPQPSFGIFIHGRNSISGNGIRIQMIMPESHKGIAIKSCKSISACHPNQTLMVLENYSKQIIREAFVFINAVKKKDVRLGRTQPNPKDS